MRRLDRIAPSFVKYIPDELDPGVVYVSLEYATAVHNCCCGCGNKVVTPLSPAQWSLTFDGESLSLSPSIGNGALPCNSHYVITRNAVRWAPSLSTSQTVGALRRDRAAVDRHYAPPPAVSSAPQLRRRQHRWQLMRKWFSVAVKRLLRRVR